MRWLSLCVLTAFLGPALGGCGAGLKQVAVQPSPAETPAPKPAAEVAPAPVVAKQPQVALPKLDGLVASLTAPVSGPGNPTVRETSRQFARWVDPGVDPRLWQARAWESLRKPADALALWESLAEKSIGGVEVLNSFATLAQAQGRSDVAVRVLSRRLQGRLADPDLNGVLGWVYLAGGETAKALTALENTWRTPAARRYALLLGRARLLSGKPDGALEAARLATEQPSQAASAWVLLGEIHRTRAVDTSAEKAYRKALELRADDYGATVGLGLLSLGRGKASEAEVLFSAACRAEPKRPEGWNGSGLARRALGDYQGAAEAFGKALEASGRFAPALKNLAILNEKYLARPADAVLLYERYLALRPGDPEVERWKKASVRLAEGGAK